jgi:hypothetical protein
MFKVFQADEAKRILKYAFIPINVDDDAQLLHYMRLLLPDYEVFDLFRKELEVFQLDLIDIAERNEFEMLDELVIALSAQDRVCSSKINQHDVISEVIFSEIVECEVPERKQDHTQYPLEKSLDFTYFDLPNIGYGASSAVFIIDDDYDCFGTPTVWPVEEEEPRTPDYDPGEGTSGAPMSVQFNLKRHRDSVEYSSTEDEEEK